MPLSGTLAGLCCRQKSLQRQFTACESVHDSSLTSLPYRKDIDGLRSVAVLLVLLFHFDLGHFFRAGFVGVDIFFVISGFLIGSILRQQISDGSFKPILFYVRRIRRLAPALLGTVGLSLAAGCLLLTPTELAKLGEEAAAAQLYVSNIYYWRFLSYFGLQAEKSPFLHTWSLGVEEQFYLIFPLILWAVFRWRGSHVATLLWLGLASFALNLAGVWWKPEATFYLLPTRMWEFACGALVPELITFSRRWQMRRDGIAAAGILGLSFTLLSFRQDVLFPGWFAALPVGSTVALLVAGASGNSWYSKIASARAPVYLGRISYELYLVHWPVHVFAPLILYNYSFPARFCCFLLCLPAAAIIYHGLSVPVRRAALFPSQRAVFVAYITATAILLTGAAAAIYSHGFPSRFGPNIAHFADGADDQNLAYRHCEGHPIGSCRIGAAAEQPTWLIYGDSHADALADAFREYLSSRHQAAYFSFVSGCLPVLSSGDTSCRRFNGEAVRFLKSHPEIQIVTLVSTWRQPLEPRYTDASGALVSGKAALAAFHDNLARTIRTYRSAGRLVIVWMPLPGARKDVPGTFVRNALLGRHWDIRFSRNDYERTFRFLFDDVEEQRGVTLIRPAQYICAAGECAVLVNGRPLYRDNAHPAASQSSFFERIISAELKGLAEVGGSPNGT